MLSCIAILLLGGCGRGPTVHKSDDPVALARQFTNILARGSVRQRTAAAAALNYLAREACKPPLFDAVAPSLLSATSDGDTNVSLTSFEAWISLCNTQTLPSWTVGVVSNCARRGLAAADSRIRCAAGLALLRFNRDDTNAATVVMNNFATAEEDIVRPCINDLAEVSQSNAALRSQVLAAIRHVTDSGTPDQKARSIWPLQTLGRITGDANAQNELPLTILKLLNSPELETRRRTLAWMDYALSEAPRDEGVLSKLESLLEDQDIETAVRGACFINRLKILQSSNILDRSLAIINTALTNRSPALRQTALKCMNRGQRWWAVVQMRTNRTGNVVNISTHATTADPRIVQALTNALDDVDWTVRVEAAIAIRMLEELEPQCRPQIPELLERGLASKDPAVQKAVAPLIYVLPEERAVPFRRALLQSKDPKVIEAACSFYPYQVTPYEALRDWDALCTSSDPVSRYRAGMALLHLARYQAVGPNQPWPSIPKNVLRLIDDPHPQVSAAGLGVLGTMACATNQTPANLEARNKLDVLAATGPSILRARIAGLFDQPYYYGRLQFTRVWVFSELGTDVPSGGPAGNLLSTFAQDADPDVRLSACRALRARRWELPVTLTNDPDPEVRRIARLPLPEPPSYQAGRPKPPESIESLLTKLKSSDPATRRSAGVALGSSPDFHKREALQDDVFQVLVQDYGGAASGLPAINRVLCQLTYGPKGAARRGAILELLDSSLQGDNLDRRRGAWALLADIISSLQLSPEIARYVPQILEAVSDEDAGIRLPVVQSIRPILDGLRGSTEPGNANTIRALQTALIGSVSDPNATVAGLAATYLVMDKFGRVDMRLVIPNGELQKLALEALVKRFADPDRKLREMVAGPLALVASTGPQPDRAKALEALDLIGSTLAKTADQNRPYSDNFFSSNPSASMLPHLAPGTLLTAIAVYAQDSQVRKRAVEILAQELSGTTQQARSRQNDLLNNFRNQLSSLRSLPDELEPLTQPLLKLVLNTNDWIGQTAGGPLGRMVAVSPRIRQNTIDWMDQRSKSASADERLEALICLDALSMEWPQENWRDACALARPACSDSNETVRITALGVLGKALGKAPQGISADDAQPLVTALEKGSSGEKKAAADALGVLVFGHWFVPTELVRRIAPEILRHLPSSDYRVRHSIGSSLERVVSLVSDTTLKERVLEDLHEKVRGASRDEERGELLQLVGELQLALGQNSEAVISFRQALQLAPERANGVRPRLEKALYAAGQNREVALEPPARPDSREFDRQIQEFATKSDAESIVRVADRALQGYAKDYAGHSSRGWSEPDFLVKKVSDTLLALHKLEPLDRFLSGAVARFPNHPQAWDDMARLRLAQGKPEEALSLYEQNLSARFWDHEAQEGLNKVCRQLNRMNRFEALLKSLVQQHPENQPLCHILTEFYVNEKRTNDALIIINGFREAAKKDPQQDQSNRPEWLDEELSRLLVMVGDYEGAIQAARKAIEVNGERRPNLKQNLATLLQAAGKTNELAQLAETDPKVKLQTLHQQIRTHLRNNQVPQALERARQLLATESTDRRPLSDWNDLFMDFSTQNQRQLLLPLFEELLAKKPHDADLLQVLTVLCLQNSAYAKAAEYGEKAHQLAPEDTDKTACLAAAYYEGGRLSDSFSLLLEILRRKPDSAPSVLTRPFPRPQDTNALVQLFARIKEQIPGMASGNQSRAARSLAYVSVWLGDRQEANRQMLRVMADPGQWYSGDRKFLFDDYLKCGKFDEAIELCRRTPGYSMNDPNRILDLGRVYLRKGMTNEAVEAFKSSQRYSGCFKQIELGQASAGVYNEVAWMFVENGVGIKEGLEYARKAAALAPGDAAIRDTLGWALVLNGQYEAGFTQFAPVLTNTAETLPGVSGLSKSAWKALRQIARSDVPAPVFLGFVGTLSNALTSQPLGMVQLNQTLATFHDRRGAEREALAARVASGYPNPKSWLILGPFPNELGQKHQEALIPEANPEIDQKAQYQGWFGMVGWGSRASSTDLGWIDLGEVFEGLSWATAYAWTSIESDGEREAELHVGSDDQLKVWLEGALVYENLRSRPLKPDEEIVTVKLRKGANRMLIKSCNERERWEFSTRVTGPAGAALNGVRF